MNLQDAARPFRTEFKAMGSACEIAISQQPAENARRLMAAAIQEVFRIERKYSRYRHDDESIIHRINAAAGHEEPVRCDAETLQLLGLSARLFDRSDGLFDVTSGVLRRAWDFKAKAPPPADRIAVLLPLIGWDKVELTETSVRLPIPGMEIDFGGFGKEYAVDRAAKTLVAGGVTSGYVSLGGDIYAIGRMPDGTPWRFGVRDPRKATAVIANIPVTDGALVTSGDYEKFIQVGDVYYSHILHPKTGMPVRYWRSVSVAGVSALSAGAIATIAMLKEAGALSFLKGKPCSYLLVDGEGRLTANKPGEQLE